MSLIVSRQICKKAGVMADGAVAQAVVQVHIHVCLSFVCGVRTQLTILNVTGISR